MLKASSKTVCNPNEWQGLIAAALKEDIGQGDVTSKLLLEPQAQATLLFQNREPMVMAANLLVAAVYEQLSDAVKVEVAVHDGEYCSEKTTLITVTGNAQLLLTGERVALNLLQRACAVATLTRRYVKAVEGTGVQILDTRKTMPAMRGLDKYAVTCGGGFNHRMRLDDRILIKDNHIAVCGGIVPALKRAKSGNKEQLLIEIECDTLAQMQEVLAEGADWILLDNMPPERLREAVQMNREAGGNIKLEASGGVNLQTVRAIAETAVDAISVGALTHSAPAIDIGLDVAISSNS